MNRHEIAALVRGIVAVAVGLLPFAALGLLVSWWLAGGLLGAGVGGAGVWWARSPWRCWL